MTGVPHVDRVYIPCPQAPAVRRWDLVYIPGHEPTHASPQMGVERRSEGRGAHRGAAAARLQRPPTPRAAPECPGGAEASPQRDAGEADLPAPGAGAAVPGRA